MFALNTDSTHNNCSAAINTRRSSTSPSACPVVRQCADHIRRTFAAGIALFAQRLTSCQRTAPYLMVMVHNMLINKLHKLNINCDKFNESKKLLEDLNRIFREIETLENDPEYYIDAKTFEKLLKAMAEEYRRELLGKKTLN